MYSFQIEVLLFVNLVLKVSQFIAYNLVELILRIFFEILQIECNVEFIRFFTRKIDWTRFYHLVNVPSSYG